MIRKVFSLLLAIVFAFAAMLPASAAGDKVWRVTATAHVLSVSSSGLWVSLDKPDKLQVNENVFVWKSLNIPYQAMDDIDFVGNDGGKINNIDIQTGQKVRVTFRFTTYQAYDGSDEWYIRPLSCLQVQLMEKVKPRKSVVTPWDLSADEAIGVIVPGERGKKYVSIECGYTKTENGNVYTSHGGGVEISANTKIYDTKGGLVPAAGLKLWQRVRVKLSDAEFYDGSPGFEWSGIRSVRLLADGEQLMDSSGFSMVPCTVTGHSENDYGELRLHVKPDSGTPEAGWQPEYIVSHENSFYDTERYENFKPGDRVMVKYLGLRRDGDAPGGMSCDTGGVIPLEKTEHESIID